MDKTEITFDEIKFVPKNEENLDMAPGGEIELGLAPEGEDETDHSEDDGDLLSLDAADINEEEKQSFSLIRFLSAIVAFTFCAASAAVYITGAVSAASAHLNVGFENILTGEVFHEYSYETLQSEPDILPAPPDKAEDTDNQGGTDNTPDDKVELYPSQRADLSVSPDAAYDLNNQTSFAPDVASLLKTGNENMTCEQIYKKYGEDAPVVLIVHTHGTESYSADEEDYSADDSFRTENTEENVIAVGEIMAKVFEKAGINVIHDTEMYDRESYKDSYSRSYAAVQTWLEKYPSIAYVFDVHRDAIIKEDMTKICPVGSYGGDDVAQIMLVVGTDEGGADHETWEKNLSFALEVQSNLVKSEPSLARAVNLRSAAFNQGLSSGFLLLEIGSCGNTLEQAKRCSILTTLAISDAISEKKTNLDPKKLFEELV